MAFYKHTNTCNTLRCINQLLTVVISLACLNVSAADIAREKTIANAINDSLVIGESVTLTAGSVEFIGLINDDTPMKAKGTVILLHGMGAHPNMAQVIQPLRSNLTEHGWVTLSIQLPVLANDAKRSDYMPLVKEAAPRIAAALSYIDSKHPKPFIIVGHSLGALMATSFLANEKNNVSNAIVAIGLPTFKTELTEASTPDLLKKIDIPLLDIYGSQDLPSVKQMAATRKQLFIKNNPANRQVEITGADHFFNGLDDTLSGSIHGWLVNTLKDLGKPSS